MYGDMKIVNNNPPPEDEKLSDAETLHYNIEDDYEMVQATLKTKQPSKHMVAKKIFKKYRRTIAAKNNNNNNNNNNNKSSKTT